ncbi:MAG: hypothetical protein KC910_01520 [Candidatus Eremiobacteraeota bacterium]|nr:hypothetical protein [Candidatus Eremiobacteraeota bacterium]
MVTQLNSLASGQLRYQARLGLEAANQRYWRFWKTTELRTEAVEQVLDRMETCAQANHDQDASRVLAWARQTPNLNVYRKTLSAVAAGAVAGVEQQAGLALSLAEGDQQKALGYLHSLGQEQELPLASQQLELIHQPPVDDRELAQRWLGYQGDPMLGLGHLQTPIPLPADLSRQANQALAGDLLTGLAQGRQETSLEQSLRWVRNLELPQADAVKVARAGLDQAGAWKDWHQELEANLSPLFDRLRLARELMGPAALGLGPDRDEKARVTARLLRLAGSTDVAALAQAMLDPADGWTRFVASAAGPSVGRALADAISAGLEQTDTAERIRATGLSLAKAAPSVEERTHFAAGTLNVLKGLADDDTAATIDSFQERIAAIKDPTWRADLLCELASTRVGPGPLGALQLASHLYYQGTGVVAPADRESLVRAGLERALELDGGHILAPALREALADQRPSQRLASILALTESSVYQLSQAGEQGDLKLEDSWVDINGIEVAIADSDPSTTGPAAGHMPERVARQVDFELPPLAAGSRQPVGHSSLSQQRLEGALSKAAQLDGNYSSKTAAIFTAAALTAPDRIDEAANLGERLDNNYSTKSRAVFTLAAAVDPDFAEQAGALGEEFDRDYSTKSRAYFTLGAALAGSPDRSRQAAELAEEFDHDYSTKTRCLLTVAAAIAGSREAFVQAWQAAGAADGGNSHKTRSVFAVAAAIAGSQSGQVFDLAQELDGNNSTRTRAMAAVACAIAGTPERAREAHELSSSWGDKSWGRARALQMMACAGALNPARAGYAMPIQWDFLWPPDD